MSLEHVNVNDGATVSYDSGVPIWNFPEFMKLCQETAEHLNILNRPVSLRFFYCKGDMCSTKLTAELAHANVVFARIWPSMDVDEVTNESYIVIRIASPSNALTNTISIGRPMTGTITDEISDCIKKKAKQLLRRYLFSKRLFQEFKA